MNSTGLAKSYYLQNFGSSPWNLSTAPSNIIENDFIKFLYGSEIISYCHQLLIHKYVSKVSLDLQLGLSIFFAFILSATQLGHICVRINGAKIYPDIPSIWPLDNSPLNYAAVKKMMLTVVNQVDFAALTPALINFHNCFYIPKCFQGETRVVNFFIEEAQKFDQGPILENLDLNTLYTNIKKILLSKRVSLQQSQAILNVIYSSVALITGGPGTGKSYTAIYLIKILDESISRSQIDPKKAFKVVICAPTGKAAANFQKSLASLNLKNSSIETKTLHSLLGVNKPIQEFSDYDLIIVDEASMIDLNLMSQLLEFKKKNSRVVLIGDVDQLPAVGSGNIFADLISFVKNIQHQIPANFFITHTALDKCQRTDEVDLLKSASLIKKGNVNGFFELTNGGLSNFIRVKLKASRAETEGELANLLKPVVVDLKSAGNSIDMIYDAFNKFKILSPLKSGCWGVDFINELVHKQLRKLGINFFSPIIINENDRSLNIYNGDMGLLYTDPLNPAKNLAYFKERGEKEQWRRIFPQLIPSFNYAYCMSIHKSQGCEFENIAVFLPEENSFISRELLYTAVTRARKKVYLFAEDSAITACLLRKSYRKSNILTRLKSIL